MKKPTLQRGLDRQLQPIGWACNAAKVALIGAQSLLQPCFTRNGKTHIAARLEGDVQRRLAVETDLIRNYRTTCND